MTLEEKVAKIVDRLLKKTIEGTVTWEESGDDESVCNLPDFMVGVKARPGYSGTYHSISLYDDNGQMIRTFIGGEIGRQQQLSELHELASRQASGLDEKLDALLERLDRAS